MAEEKEYLTYEKMLYALRAEPTAKFTCKTFSARGWHVSTLNGEFAIFEKMHNGQYYYRMAGKVAEARSGLIIGGWWKMAE